MGNDENRLLLIVHSFKYLDEFMEARVPDYKGCMPKDDWEAIINYNFSDD